MSSQVREEASPGHGKRRPLLIHRRLNEQVFWPCILLVAISAGLLAWDPPQVDPYRFPLSMVLLGAGLLLILTFYLRLRASVQCQTDGLHLQVPFARLLIPYRQIRATRPTEMYRVYHPTQLRWTQRAFLKPILHKPVIVVELEALPRPRPWLRLWMGPFLICPDAVGLCLLVNDWMGFRSELDEFRARRGRPRTPTPQRN